MNNKKILICDEEEGVREALKLVLSDRYDLIMVDSGKKALHALAKTEDIGIVVLDIALQEGLKTPVGFDLIRIIKLKYPNVKIIVVTICWSVEAVTEASRLGVSGYIIKPFKSEEILETIKNNLWSGLSSLN